MLSLAHLGTIFQGLALLLPLSILLGRVYFLKYFETLGIPPSEVRLNIVEYAVVSPDVAVLGVGFVVIIAVYWWAMLEIQPAKSCKKIASGILTLIIGSLLYAWPVYFPNEVVTSGLWQLLAYVIGMFGVSLLILGLPRPKVSASSISGTDDSQQKVDFLGLIIKYSMLFVVILMLFLMYSRVSLMAEWDAARTLCHAPLASVEITDSESKDLMAHKMGNDQEAISTVTGRVILLGNEFLYVSTQLQGQVRTVRALPTVHVVGLEYMHQARNIGANGDKCDRSDSL